MRWTIALLAMFVATPFAAAQDLGRLFTTPSERIQLDEIRRQAQLPKLEPEEPEPEPVNQTTQAEPEPVQPVVDRLTINGLVRRSRGPGTVWVNGDEVERGGMTREGIRIQDSGRIARNIRIRLPSGADTIELKPGQEIDVHSGMVLESYERRPSTSGGRSAFSQSADESAARDATAGAPVAGAGSPAEIAPEEGDAMDLSPDGIAALPVAEKAAALQRLRRLAGQAGGGADAPVARP